MSDIEPVIKLQLPDGEFEATRDNATLFTFAGNLASRSHVFLQTGDVTEHSVTGSYIFAIADCYKQLAQFMIRHQYPMHLNLREVAQCDEDAYQRNIDQYMATQDFDEVPDWLE